MSQDQSLPEKRQEEDYDENAASVTVVTSGLKNSRMSTETWHSECLGKAAGGGVVYLLVESSVDRSCQGNGDKQQGKQQVRSRAGPSLGDKPYVVQGRPREMELPKNFATQNIMS